MSDYSEKIPLWYQLSQRLRSEIVDGMRLPGSKILPEIELANGYSVSVITVRQALKLLEEDGLINRQRGRGSFVANPLPHRHIQRFSEAEHLMFAEDFSDAKVLEKSQIPVPPELEAVFPGETKLLRLRRVVWEGGAPFSYAVIHMPTTIGSSIKLADFRKYPMFRILREYGYELGRVYFKFRAMAAPIEIAKLLELEAFSPILAVSPRVVDAKGKTLCVLTVYYPGETFNFAMNSDFGQT